MQVKALCSFCEQLQECGTGGRWARICRGCVLKFAAASRGTVMHPREHCTDSEGDFSEPEKELYICCRCEKRTATCRTWDSSCGGYQDYKYECSNCRHSWWVDGIDS